MSMTAVQRFDAVMEGRAVDRLPRVEWAAWWDQTINRWYDEGLDRKLDGVEAQRHFGLDVWHRVWLGARGPGLPKPEFHGGPIVQSEADYDRFVAEGCLFPSPQTIFHPGLCDRLAKIRQLQDDGELMWLSVDGYFWMPRTILGIEPHLYSFYDQPELLHRIIRDNLTHNLQIIRGVLEMARPAFVCICEDMSYNLGPMLSRDLFDTFLKPAYLQVTAFIREQGLKTFIDSDGDITQMVPWLLESGIDGILPLERQAGVDVNAIRRSHPKFCMVGAFDKMTMTRGTDAMRGEFERLMPAMRTGRFIPSVDHQTPPGVSLAQYEDYIQLLDEYTIKAATGQSAQERVTT